MGFSATIKLWVSSWPLILRPKATAAKKASAGYPLPSGADSALGAAIALCLPHVPKKNTTTQPQQTFPSSEGLGLGLPKKQTTRSLPSLVAEHQENCGAFVFLSPFFGYLFWRSKKLTKKQPHQIANTHPHAKFPSRVYTERSRSRGVSEGRGGCT